MSEQKKYLYVPKKYYNTLNLSQFPSTGKNPNISGMREKYWGEDALIIKCCNYAYKVDYDTFKKAEELLKHFSF